jgi:hypothetical protein
MRKKDVLSALTFGSRIAEEEGEALTRYFVETDYWDRLFAGEIDIVYGLKGSGKSALYALLLARKDELLARGIAAIPGENPRGSAAFRGVLVDPPATESEFINFWKLYVCCLISELLSAVKIESAAAKELRETLMAEQLLRGDSILEGLLLRVKNYVRKIATGAQAIEGGIELNEATGMLKGIKAKITFEEPSAEDIRSGIRSVDQLILLANAALEQGERHAWILLDRLDVVFADNDELEARCLRALFRVYQDLQARDRIRLKIFLRSDIWRRITSGGFRESSHITRAMTITWEASTLLNLVVRRAIQNEVVQKYYAVEPGDVLSSTTAQKAFFDRMFPDQVEVGSRKSTTFDWILVRCSDGTRSTAPREVIHLLNALRSSQARKLDIGEAEPEGEQMFSRMVFKDALAEVSVTRLEQTLFQEYPALKPFIEKLRGEKTSHAIETLAEIWRVTTEDATAAVQKLIDVGFFEQRGSREKPEFWVPFLYRDALGLVQGRASGGRGRRRRR